MEPLKQYERVRLVTDRYESEGARRGMIGFIIEIYNGDAFEVEFCRSDGVTVAQIVAAESDLERHPEP
jgi:hypothetical protein